MQKRQLIEMVKRRLGNDGRFGDRTIAMNMGVAWQTVIGTFKDKPQALDFYTKTYTGIPISYDENKRIYYSELPEAIMHVLDPSSGVRYINTTQTEGVRFVPITSQDVKLIKDLDVSKVQTGLIGYLVRNNRVEYQFLTEDIAKVNMDLVVAFDKISMEDDISLPQEYALNLVGYTMELLEGTPFVGLHNRRINTEPK